MVILQKSSSYRYQDLQVVTLKKLKPHFLLLNAKFVMEDNLLKAVKIYIYIFYSKIIINLLFQKIIEWQSPLEALILCDNFMKENEKKLTSIKVYGDRII